MENHIDLFLMVLARLQDCLELLRLQRGKIRIEAKPLAHTLRGRFIIRFRAHRASPTQLSKGLSSPSEIYVPAPAA